MAGSEALFQYNQLTEIEPDKPTLIEGLPGHGLVAAIAVDQVTSQLALEQHGTIISDTFPPVTAFKDGRVRDLVRVYAGAAPSVMTLQSDVAIPPPGFKALSQCVLEDLAKEFERAIFLAGAPAQTEAQIGEISGVATTNETATEVTNAGIPLADGTGLVGGVTGALVNECYTADVPAIVLIVQANPYLPDPAAAKAVIENALEPLVDFDIDTSELEEKAEIIEQQLQQVAKQYQEMVQEREEQAPPSATPSMYQ